MKTPKRITGLLLAATLMISLSPARSQTRIVCDETCKLESAAPAVKSAAKNEAPAPKTQAAQETGYSVVGPVGRSTVEMIPMANRLETLEGKRIAIVGGSFMARVTHPEIKRLIQQHYPKTKVYLFDEIGAAGVYPAPGVVRKSKEDFQQRLREERIDAVISGNGGCGLCTPKETGSCIAAEYIGIPSVIIAGPGFTDQARYTALNNGVPVLRIAEYPGAFALHTEDELIRNTREILWPRIVEALTKPITKEEIEAGSAAPRGDIRDDVFYGTLEEVNRYFADNNWTDGLPIVPPTFEKVSEFMKYTPYKWNETVAVLPIAHRNTTAWHVAVNAVMAGCKPEYMPILIAMTKALGDGQFRRTLASTHAWVPFSWLNGPVARQLGVDSGQGEINEAANMAIGRFMNLALMNLCGYYVKQDRMGTFGYPMSWCLVEDDAACLRVGWKPYHVRKGFDLNDNTITLASTLLWGNNMAPSTTDPEKMMELLAWDISERCQFALGSGKPFTFRTILMTEPVAKTLSSAYRTPDRLEDKLIEESRRPLKERAFANYYANPGGSKENHTLQQYTGWLRRSEGAQTTGSPAWYDTPESRMETVATMRKGMTVFLITGDAARNKVQTMPGGGYATAQIELPHNWDALTATLGYEPLSNFRL